MVGCHRSGTSAVAGCAALLGADTGKAPMVGASRSNPKGHYESSDVVWAHRMIQQLFDADWNDPKMPDDWTETEDFQTGAGLLGRLLERDFDGPLSVVKDPRMATLFPLWEEAARLARVDLVAILVDREEKDIVRSLMHRDSRSTGSPMTPPKATRLIAVSLNGMKEWESIPHVRVRFPDDLLSGIGVWERVEAELNHAWPIPAEKAAGRIRAFVTPGLIHASSAA